MPNKLSRISGRNDKGQLGTKDCTRRDVPTFIEGLQEHTFVDAAVGRNHSLLLTGNFNFGTFLRSINFLDDFIIYSVRNNSTSPINN